MITMLVSMKCPSSAPSHAKRFACRWAIVFSGLLLLAVIEGVVLWWSGFQYRHGSAFSGVSVSDLSIDASGDRVATVVSFKQHSDDDGLWKDVVLMDLRHQHTARLKLRKLDPQCVAIAPHSDVVAFADSCGTIYSLPVEFGPQTKTISSDVSLFAATRDRCIRRLIFSPDEQYVIAAGSYSLFVWDWRSGRRVHHFSYTNLEFSMVEISPDSQMVLSQRSGIGWCIWNIRSGDVIERLALSGKPGMQVAWPFGRQLITTVSAGQLHVRGIDSKQSFWTAPVGYLGIDLAFCPHGRVLAYVGRTEGIQIREAESGLRVGSVNTNGLPVKGLKFASDGRLYAWDAEGNIRVWDAGFPTQVSSLSLLQWASRAGESSRWLPVKMQHSGR